MRLYFDKSFIENFALRTDKGHPVIEHFIFTIFKKLRGVDLFLNGVDSTSEFIRLTENNRYFSWLSEVSPVKLESFSFKGLLKIFNESCDSIVYVTDNPEEGIKSAKENFLIISNATLIEDWQPFFQADEIRSFSVGGNSAGEGVFTKWDDLKIICHPKKKILLFDLYALGNKTGQKILDNIIPCLKSLSNKSNNSKLKVYIVTYEIESVNNKDSIWSFNDTDRMHRMLSRNLNQVAALSIFKYNKSRVQGAKEHNRFIITDYFIIEAAAGFNVFKADGSISHIDRIRIEHLFQNAYRRDASNYIGDLNKYVKTINSIEKVVVGPGKFVDDYHKFPSEEFHFEI